MSTFPSSAPPLTPQPVTVHYLDDLSLLINPPILTFGPQQPFADQMRLVIELAHQVRRALGVFDAARNVWTVTPTGTIHLSR
jgi:hypothetical protein